MTENNDNASPPKDDSDASPSFEELIQEFELAMRPQVGEETAAPTTAPSDSLSLDEILKDSTVTRQEPEAEVKPSVFDSETIRDKARLETLYGWAIDRDRKEAAAAAERDLESAVKYIIEEKGLNATERMVKSYLVNEFHTDQRFNRAFLNRHNNTLQWENAIKRATNGLMKELSSLPDPEVTADVNAIAAAVRASNSRTPTPETPKNMNKMSDREFNAHLQEQGLR